MTGKASARSADDLFDLARAIEVFARGFAFTRSFTYPCLAERVGPLWVIRDAPRKRAGDYRNEEWVATGVEAAQVDAAARQGARGRLWICAIRGINEPDGPLRAAYKAIGYRLQTTEAFMAHPLLQIPTAPEPFPVSRVVSQELADRLAKVNRRRLALAEHLAEDSPLRLYAALAGEKPVGWLRSIVVGDCTWVSSVYVDPKYRRRGIGKSMLAAMLRDDRAHQARQSVLLASHAGALLYPNVGYRQIGQLFMYAPRKR